MAKMNKMGEINRTQENVHKEPRDNPGPAAKKGGSEVGNEKKADVRGTQEGGSRAEAMGSVLHGSSVGETHLKHAMHELHSQHPISHNDHGPHHGKGHHHRHQPVGKVYR